VSVRYELSPRQLRALLFLLVLLPLSPTVWMFRFMSEAIRSEHAEDDQRLGDVYRQALATATGLLKNHFAVRGQGERVKADAVLDFYRLALDPAVQIRIVGVNGAVLAGSAPDATRPIAENAVGDVLPGARVEVYPTPRPGTAMVEEQISTYGWAVAAVAVANVSISGAAVIALQRQSRLREMQSSALATVAHELKTPLASMRVLTDTLLGMNVPDPERCRSYVQLVATENDRLIRLAENFLTLARFETNEGVLQKSPVEPAMLAQAAVKSLESRFKEAGIEPETQVEGGLPTVTVNRESTVVALANLLDNALKYSEPGQPVGLQVQARDGVVQFVVEDHGIGIPAEAQKRIFDRFFQADQKLARTREGCGLGLHIVRSIVEAHGGTVTVRSTVGKGSTFCMSLPATKVG